MVREAIGVCEQGSFDPEQATDDGTGNMRVDDQAHQGEDQHAGIEPWVDAGFPDALGDEVDEARGKARREPGEERVAQLPRIAEDLAEHDLRNPGIVPDCGGEGADKGVEAGIEGVGGMADVRSGQGLEDRDESAQGILEEG